MLLIISVVRVQTISAETTAKSTYLEAVAAFEAQRLHEARQHAEYTLQQYPSSDHAKEARFLLARILEAEGKFGDALSTYQAYLKSQKFSVHRQEAALKVQLIRQAIKKNATASLAVLLEALRERERGNYAEAIKICRSMLKLPLSYMTDDAQHLIAYIQLMDLQDFNAATASYQKLLDVYKRSNYYDNALFGIGIAFERLNKFDEAEQAFNRLRDKHASINLGGVALPKDNYFSRIWFRKSTRRLDMLAVHREIFARSSGILAAADLNLGVGDRLYIDQPIGSRVNYRPLWSLTERHRIQPTYVTHWITRSTNWNWETPDRLKACVVAGYTPVISYWYFGDEISPSFVRKHQQAWMDNIQLKLIPLIRDLPEVIVLLEPEFNKNGIVKWKEWDALAERAIKTIRRGAPRAKVGITIGDWGNYEEEDLAGSIRTSGGASDFIGFLEMVSSTNEHSSFDPSFSLVERSNVLTQYLQDEFRKPLFFAYVAISSAGGWEEKQAAIVNQMAENLPMYIENGVFGIGMFSLYDDPHHEGWFSNAEKYFGMVTQEELAKPVLKSWQRLEGLLQKADSHSPSVLDTPVFSQDVIDFRSDKSLQMDLNLSEWCRWEVRFHGARSGAIFAARGAGKHVWVSWEGIATFGEFQSENVRVELTATDKSGKRLSQQAVGHFSIKRPFSVRQEYALALEGDVNAFAWGRGAGATSRRFHGRGGGGSAGLRCEFPEFPSGVIIDPVIQGAKQFSDQAVLDLSQWRMNGFIKLKLQLSDNAEGLMLGLEDLRQNRTEVRLSAYLPITKIDSREVLIAIPLSDFPGIGRFESSAGVSWDRIDWSNIAKIRLTSTSVAQRLQLSKLNFILK